MEEQLIFYNFDTKYQLVNLDLAHFSMEKEVNLDLAHFSIDKLVSKMTSFAGVTSLNVSSPSPVVHIPYTFA